MAGERLHQLLMDNGVGPDPSLREPRARHDLVDLAVNEPGGPAGERGGHRLEQSADSGQSAARERGRGLIGVTGHIQPGGDLGGDLVGHGILNRRIVDQRLHGRYKAASVADLAGHPDGQHRDRRKQTADHDQDRAHQGPPAKAPTAGRPSRLPGQPVSFILQVVPPAIAGVVGWSTVCALAGGVGLQNLDAVEDPLQAEPELSPVLALSSKAPAAAASPRRWPPESSTGSLRHLRPLPGARTGPP